MKYISNGKEVTKEEFESLVGEQFKWFQNDTVNAVDYSSVSNLFRGKYVSEKQINDHIKGVLEKDDVINSVNRGEKEMIKHFKEILIPFKNGSEQMKVRVCSPQCFCDGSCKVVGDLEGINRPPKEPFSIQVPKPNPFNQSNFFDGKQSEQEILDTFKRNMERIEGVKETEGIKESQSVKKAPIFTYCKVNSLALEALAFRALYGHEKYKESDSDWQNFTRVPNAEEEYSNSMFRHALNIGEDETEEQHLIASAWNAVSRLEIFLRNK
jgi:hypothetical protein